MNLSCYPQMGYLKAANSLLTDNKKSFYKASSLCNVRQLGVIKIDLYYCNIV